MNSRLFITVVSLGAAPWIAAQTIEQSPEKDSLANLVEQIQAQALGKTNEVTVVLPPPDEKPVAAVEGPEPAPPAENSENSKPRPAEETNHGKTAAETEAPVDDTPAKPKPGLSVRVERLQTGATEIDPAQVKLLAPFPAKLLARSPEGWLIESSESAPPFTREVELSPGKRITLNVRPHLLVADADGSNVFQIAEPGFDASLGYRQNATVAAILSTSIRQLDDDSRQLGEVIDQLQQLLVSLPQTATAPEPAPEPKPETKRKR